MRLITADKMQRGEYTMIKIKWHQENEPRMHVNTREGVTYLTSPEFDRLPGVVHAFSTRLGGVSEGIYSSMNLSFTRGDKDEAVRENYRRLADAVGFKMEDIVTSDQTHTANVRLVTEEDRGNGITKPRPYTDVDGMITNVPGLVLATFYADCVPLYFIDPVHRAIGLSHSGWRGTVAKIGEVTVRRMQEEFGSDPSEIYGAVGPSICQDCYEVSEDVADAFKEAFPGHADEILLDKKNGKYQLDLWGANEIVLTEAGVLKEKIAVTNICTCCNPDLLFSHRASHGKRGNLGAFIYLRNA